MEDDRSSRCNMGLAVHASSEVGTRYLGTSGTVGLSYMCLHIMSMC